MKSLTVIALLCLMCISLTNAALYWRKIFTNPGCTDESEVAHFYFPDGGGYTCSLGAGCQEIATGQFWAIENCVSIPSFRTDFVRVTLDSTSVSCSTIRSLYTGKPDICFVFENADFTNAFKFTSCDDNGVLTFAMWNNLDCAFSPSFNFTVSSSSCDLVDFGSVTAVCAMPPMAAPVDPPIEPPVAVPLSAPITAPIVPPVADNAPKETPVGTKKSASTFAIGSASLAVAATIVSLL